MFANADKKYKDLAQRLNGSQGGQHIPKIDTLITSMKFFQENPQLLSQAKEAKEKVKDALGKVNGLKDQFQKAEDIKKFLRDRKQYLKERLGQFGFAKELKKVNKKIYYYAQQVNAYKETLKDSRKAERKAIELLSKTKLFKDFMRKNSQLASLFRLPGDPNDPSSQASLVGLQTRAQVNNLIQQQIAAGGPGAQQQFSQNLQAAQSQLSELKNKINQFGANNSDDIMPEGFRKNDQRVKSFWKKWELGFNIQSNRANTVTSVTSDLGVSAGFKPHDNFVVGIGFAGRMGWGKDIRHIAISYSGLGARSFAELTLKGSVHAVAGFEMNYRTQIREFTQLQDRSGWQKSGIVGLGKVISLKTKFFKKTKVQLLWDFLSYEQVPRTQRLLFRVGYNF